MLYAMRLKLIIKLENHYNLILYCQVNKAPIHNSILRFKRQAPLKHYSRLYISHIK
jgi:hypothetical protein